jgi:osmotically-inducible protein OsmY
MTIASRLFVVLALALLTFAVQARADDVTARDLDHEMLAWQALQSDPKLGPLNLCVKVRDRVATLWGPVPTRDLAERAVNTLRKLPEIASVRNQMMLQFAEDTVYPPMQLMPPRPGPAPLTDSSEKLAWQPALPEAPGPGPKNVAMSPPVTAPVSRAKDIVAPADPPDTAAVSSAVQSLIQSDERFARIRYEVKQGKVYLGGAVYRWSDLRELSLAVTNIPGVEAAVLREVRLEQK